MQGLQLALRLGLRSRFPWAYVALFLPFRNHPYDLGSYSDALRLARAPHQRQSAVRLRLIRAASLSGIGALTPQRGYKCASPAFSMALHNPCTSAQWQVLQVYA